MINVFIKEKRERDWSTEIGGKTCEDLEIRMIHIQAKKCPRLPEPTEATSETLNRFSFKSSRRKQPC